MEISVSISDFASRAVSFEQIDYLTNGATILPDGTKIINDDEGNITFAHYANGARVIRHSNYVLCTADTGEHWFGANQTWCKLD